MPAFSRLALTTMAVKSLLPNFSHPRVTGGMVRVMDRSTSHFRMKCEVFQIAMYLFGILVCQFVYLFLKLSEAL